MSTSAFVGNSDGLVTGLCSAPPPPPPPPPTPGQVPAMRINTVEAPAIRRPQIANNDAYEPPAAIQNAMLTKDKKPFTYTPGMGGKLDLSQIRSPRMARRVAKNANDEGIEGPPKSALEPKPTPAPNAGVNLFVQPQVAIPVFPTNIPPAPSARTPPTPPANRIPSIVPAPEKQSEPAKPVTKAEAKVTPVMVTIPVQPSSPESPGTPTQVTLAKAPTPWLQNKNKPQEELPEWAKRANVGKQSSSPDSPTSPPVYTSVQQMQQQPPSPQQWQQTQQKQQPIQQRPMSQQPQQYQYQQQQQPPQFNQQQQQKRPFSSPPGTQQAGPQTQPQERVIPIRIEDRPSVFDVKPEPGHHQFKQPSPHHKQRWGQPPVQCQGQNQVQQQPVTPPQPVQSPGGGYVIPIMIEGSDKKVGGPASNVSYSQPTVRNNAPSVENQTVKVVQQRGPPPAMQSDTGPVQSRSFRVLQKITDTDAPNDVDPELIRKLQLSDDDRVLMNKFKEQVDTDSSLHQEEDPRYRGAAIPSRAFRFLQTMTDSGEVLVPPTTPRPPSAVNKRQNRNSKTFEESQANLPPSEQQVPEPKKYMGSAIPSRSFRILQAMTAPESVATQENRQADYTCQTENNMPGNQQGVFLPPCPPPFWSPEGGWWGYYPLPYPGVTNDSYPCQPENTAYIYFPIYNQNYTGYPQYDATNNRTNTYAGVYPPCVVSVPPQSDNNYNHACGQDIDNVALPKIDQATSIPDDKSNEDKPSKDPETLNALPRWGRANSMSRTASTNSKDSDCTTAMNITDEEEIPETMMAPPINGDVKKPNRLETNTCPNGNSLNVAVPNYTYIDTSDSSDSTDSESQTDNESVAGSCKSSSDNNVDDTSSSDSDDSDSYLAYSTGLNPHRFDKDAERNATRTSSRKESCDDRHDTTSSSSERNNTDCDSDAEEQIDRDSGKTDNTAFPHQLSVIYEDVEHGESESPRLQKETPIEATDDPPDDTDTTTVSVSLPLRFKFSVSENNEDVTTVIVGDSTIKPERIKDDGKCSRYQEHRTHEKTNDVSANFLVNNDTTVDFTVKRDTSDGKRRTKNHANERQKEETAETKTEKNEDLVVPHVNFTLRKIPTRLGRINCEETVETEFTIKSRKTSARKEGAGATHGGSDKEQEGRTANANTSAFNGEDATVSKQSESVESSNVAKIDESSLETRDCGKNIPKPEVVVSECKRTAESSRDTSKNFQSANLQVEQHETRKAGNEEEEKTNKEPKHLLSVQNSREETDDEDSGVTSDMSRMISEVDTDSECTSSKNIRKYQRTQTHSRLFKLLNDDSVLQEDAEKVHDSATSREYLSLPLRSNGFNYDESYCSNYSSGLTSPDYSPVCEQSWRRLHEAENASQRVPDQNGDVFRHAHPLTRQERAVCKEDAYYQAWKTSKSPTSSDHDVVPSLAFKVLECRRPPWAYKVNVLCPRIKSTKSVPQALRTRKTTDSPIPSNPTSYVNLRTDHC